MQILHQPVRMIFTVGNQHNDLGFQQFTVEAIVNIENSSIKSVVTYYSVPL
jgi:hypothetical protein